MEISVTEVKAKLDNGDSFVFIDVREQYEYDEFNLGAQLIPLGNIVQSLDDLEEHKDKEIVIHCRSGARSGSAAQFLLQNGFTNVKNMIGGILEWKEKIGG